MAFGVGPRFALQVKIPKDAVPTFVFTGDSDRLSETVVPSRSQPETDRCAPLEHPAALPTHSQISKKTAPCRLNTTSFDPERNGNWIRISAIFRVYPRESRQNPDWMAMFFQRGFERGAAAGARHSSWLDQDRSSCQTRFGSSADHETDHEMPFRPPSRKHRRTSEQVPDSARVFPGWLLPGGDSSAVPHQPPGSSSVGSVSTPSVALTRKIFCCA